MKSAFIVIIVTMSFLWIISVMAGMTHTEDDLLLRDITLLDQFKQFFEAVR